MASTSGGNHLSSATVVVESGDLIVLDSQGVIVSLSGSNQRARYVPVEHMEIARKLHLKFFPSTFKQLSTFGYHRFPLTRPIPNKKNNKVERHSIEYEQVHFISETEAALGQLREEDELDAVSGKTGDLLILEYSEEFPVFLSQIGMSSRIKNYYRKSDDDEFKYKPSFDFGGVPGPEKVPFLGEISPGEALQSVENNLFQAPIYRHQAANTDFLLVRKGDSWFIRRCPALFCVGQQCPMQTVPTPQSKTAVEFDTNYIMANMYRYFRASKTDPPRLSTVTLRKFFPEHYEFNIPKRMRNCAFAHKLGGRGSRKDYYVLNPGFVLPSEESLMRLVTPEMYCVHYSCIAASKRLKDAGCGQHYKLLDTPNCKESTDRSLAEEFTCAPWNTTRAYFSAVNGECLFDQNGSADPTCCNQGFSYALPTAYQKQTNLASEEEWRKANPAPVNSREELMRTQILEYQQPNNRIMNGAAHAERVIASAGFSYDTVRSTRNLPAMKRMMNDYYLQYQFDLQNRVLSDSTILPDLDDDQIMDNSEEDSNRQSPDSLSDSRESRTRLIISRMKLNSEDRIPTIVQEEVTDPSVIEAYMKIRNTKDTHFIEVYAYDDEEYRKEKQINSRKARIEAKKAKAKLQREVDIATGKYVKKTPKPRRRDGGTCSNCYQKGHHRNKPICPVFGKSLEEIEKYQDMVIAERSAQLQQNSDDSDAPQVKRPPKNYNYKRDWTKRVRVKRAAQQSDSEDSDAPSIKTSRMPEQETTGEFMQSESTRPATSPSKKVESRRTNTRDAIDDEDYKPNNRSTVDEEVVATIASNRSRRKSLPMKP